MDLQMAFLGLGNMGKAISKNLVDKGNLNKPLILHNRTHSRAVDHSQRIGHSIVVGSVQEAVARADIIWTCLVNQEAVLETFELIREVGIAGKLFVDCSTVTPKATNQLARQLRDANADFVAMPVFGEPTLANAGKLICIPAGSVESIARIRPYIVGVIGKAIVDFGGEDPGNASLLKLVGNVFLLNTMETVAEGHVLAEKTGLGVTNLQKLLTVLFPIGPLMIYSNRMSTGGYCRNQPMVHLEDALALASHVIELAKESGTSLKAYHVTNEHLTVAEQHVGGKGDIIGIYGAVRLESGLQYENDAVRNITSSEALESIHSSSKNL